MNFKTRHFILSASLLLFSTFSFAQNVFIANDFVACGVGLKDSSGKWIVQPIYQNIFDWPKGHYKVLYGSKEGVIDSTGKMIIQPIYDHVGYETVYVDSISHMLFYVRIESKVGLLNTQNQFVVPLVCRGIDVGRDGTIIAEKTKKRYSIYYLDGKETVIPKKQGTEPVSLGDHMYKVSRNTFGISFIRRYKKYKPHRRRRSHLRITFRKRYGVMNDSLEIIIPKKFTGITYAPGKYKLVGVEKGKKIGYYSTAGKQIWAPVFKEDYYFRRVYYSGGNQSMMNLAGFTAVKYKKKYGIIAVNGDTILPFIYEYIYTSNSFGRGGINTNWFITKDKKEGIYNPWKRTWVLEPVFGSLYPINTLAIPGDTEYVSRPVTSYTYSYYSKKDASNGLQFLIANKNGMYGIITTAGQEILPFIYDTYRSGYGGFCFIKDTSYVFVSIPEYSLPQVRYNSNTGYKVVTTAPADLIFKKITRKNGVTFFINPDLINDSAQLELYNTKRENYVMNSQTYDHLLHTTALIITPLYPSKSFPGIVQLYTYRNTNMNYYLYDSIKEFVINPRSYFLINTLTINSRDKFHTYYSLGYSSGVFREDGLWVVKPGSYYNFYYKGELNGLSYFAISVGKNKTGIIDGNGKLLLDTAWGSVGSMHGKYVWVEKKNKKYRWLFPVRTTYTWNILDMTTNELILPKKKQSGEVSRFGENAVVIDRKEGKKLYNMDTRQFILDGNINGIFKLDSAGNYFAIRTCYGNIGLIDGNGRWLTDTIWKMLIGADNTREDGLVRYRSDYFRESHTYNYCVLSNDTGWTIFDGTKGIVSKNQETAKYLLDLSRNSFTQDSINGIIKFCNDCPSYSYADTLRKNEKLTDWQENLLFDSLFAVNFIADTFHYWNDYPCLDCKKRNPKKYYQYTWSGNYDKESLHHDITFRNESCISVSRKNLSSNFYRKGDPKDLFFTTMLFNDGPHNMLLDSLFTGNAWREFISAETSLYFESHPDIEGNCHNPYMLPMVMKDRFVLTKDGIELYPPNYKENDRQLFVPISWEKLKPYLRKDVAEKLGLK